MHANSLRVAPVVLGEGQPAYPVGLDLVERFESEVVSTPTGYTHQLWNRRGRDDYRG